VTARRSGAGPRVLMLGWEFPPRISGGLGTACHGLATALVAQGVDLTFVLPRVFGDEDRTVRFASAGGAGSDPAARIVAVGSDLVPVDSLLAPYLDRRAYEEARRSRPYSGAHDPNRMRVSARPLDFHGHYGPDLFAEVRRYATAVASIARTGTYDVVHAHDWMTYPGGRAAAETARAPFVAHVHASEFDRNAAGPDPEIVAIERDALRAADRVVCVSRYTAGVVRSRYRVDPARLRVVHNAWTRPARRAPRPSRSRPPTVLFLGRVTAQKGPATFLEAAARVARSVPAARFVLAGSGDLLPRMVERAAEEGLSERVHFTGFLDGPAVARMYARADVLVVPSLSEPFGITPLEAAGYSVPTILSERSGVAEVLPSARTVPPKDARALASKIVDLLRRPRARRALGRAARREALRLRWSTRARETIRVYREVLS
jgi:glycosyltransferase involved in cell wall biosynthesis